MNSPVEGFFKKITFCTVVSLLLVTPAIAQQPEATRDIWNTAYGSDAPVSLSKKTGVKTNPVKRYRNVTPQVSAKGVAADTVLGVTVWKLRSPRPGETGERILIQSGPQPTSWIPVRISANSQLTEGSLIRLSIEPARTGFLYVIDREQYADGSLGEPHLIFPTSTIRSGNNEVRKGQVIELPDRRDEIPCFRLDRSRPDHIGEVLTVLVTPQPLENITPGAEALKLTEAQVSEWEKQWGKQTGQLELTSGAGKPWTKTEKEAGADQTRELKSGDPVPQTIFYSSEVKAGDPMLVRLKLKYGNSATAKK
jgi:hypothetical protein